MESGFTARLAGLPAIAARRPGSLSGLPEALPRAVTHRVAQSPSTRLFEAAGLILLLTIGLAMGAVGVWIVVSIPMTAIVALLLADIDASRSAAAGPRDRVAPAAPRAPGTPSR